MLKIGDFSKFGQISVKALRYYDEIGLLKPVLVDQFTGYRFYSPDQLTRLQRINGLKELGLSLEEISRILTDDLPIEKVIELLKIKQQDVIGRLREEENRLKRIEDWLQKIEMEGIMPAEIVIKKVESQNVSSLRDIIPTYGHIYQLFDELCSYVGRQRVQFTGPPMAIYYDHEYREKDVDVELAIPVAGNLKATDRIKVYRTPEIAQAACLIHQGPYENFSQSYRALMTWVEANGYQIGGPNREIYLKGPDTQGKSDPSGFITEIQLPVQKV
jgi:effector-binding domain-containing protein